MGKRGPAPKPTALKLVEGNPGKRPLNMNEPKPEKGAPKCPPWLPAEGKREWKRVVPELERLELLAKVDGATLAAYCAAWARLVDAEKFIAENGTYFVTKDKNGEVSGMSKVPQVSIAEKAAADVRAFAKEFGLTPSSRSGLAAPKKPSESKMGQFLSKRAGGHGP